MSSLNAYRSNRFLNLFYWLVRLGLGVTFIISGIRKLPGVKFTTLPASHPVGHYFEAMHATGFYWNFIGVVQILLGILVFFNRTAIAAIIMMLPITINIFLVSIALNMRGTPIITAAMVLGNVFLMLWHYKNYQQILSRPITS